jgi:Mn-dependent DtxR family transcriptional regulator
MSKYVITTKGKKTIAKGTDLVKAVQQCLYDGELSAAEIAKELKIAPKVAKMCINILAAQGYIEKKRGEK